MKNRFYVTDKDLFEVVTTLHNKGFAMLPNCFTEKDQSKKSLIINTKDETFWKVDVPAYRQTLSVISNHFNELIYPYDPEEIFNNTQDQPSEESAIKNNDGLIDDFAKSALQGELASMSDDTVFDINVITGRAYKLATSMLASRQEYFKNQKRQ
jgi:hypothetical protein